jgi:hypothetical protein
MNAAGASRSHVETTTAVRVHIADCGGVARSMRSLRKRLGQVCGITKRRRSAPTPMPQTVMPSIRAKGSTQANPPIRTCENSNEPLGELHTVPLYRERYQLLTCAGSPLGEREKVTWADVARIPLCLLTPDMQNRRIIDRLLVDAAAPPPLESNSMLVSR